ncbi:hypothetical protein [Mycolicibacterium neoaurum]|uniref:hypothetical protein n=1 Tax=Mycolicibacterium neoaurum TaxID=1795 RepID=UPI001F4C853B|nr:hypothetical protein [Mycolicibacterium neoaurum]
MSLDTMHSEIDGLRGQAAELADDYARTQYEISSDPNLTDAGKKDALAPLNEDLRTKVAALRQRETEVVQKTREALERQLYGTSGSSADITSFRGAQDIAARITDSDEAHERYITALRSDDKILARAIFQRATTQGWDKVLKDHVTRNPSVKPLLDDLNTIRRYEQNTLAATMHYTTPGLSTQRPVSAPIISSGEMKAFFFGRGR